MDSILIIDFSLLAEQGACVRFVRLREQRCGCVAQREWQMRTLRPQCRVDCGGQPTPERSIEIENAA